jgi:hypothetical protein
MGSGVVREIRDGVLNYRTLQTSVIEYSVPLSSLPIFSLSSEEEFAE